MLGEEKRTERIIKDIYCDSWVTSQLAGDSYQNPELFVLHCTCHDKEQILIDKMVACVSYFYLHKMQISLHIL